ncbi:MAG: carboxylating nicotinate-nucleotide diphosphorylase [Planctomycetes bacterium]|nr:carboxylating nicotinate-nucleotide diphosphorylase [Planctomycetota bacterium]
MIPIHSLISIALKEDIGSGDITTNTLIPTGHKSTAYIIAKEPGFICGLSLIAAIYKRLGRNIRVSLKTRDGAKVKAGQVVAIVKGPTRAILSGERTVLNFLQRLSGIATLTNQFVNKVKGTGVKILDTRKTVPGWRLLDKYAVKAGGGFNHRLGLYDAFLIKNNHIKAMRDSGIRYPVSGIVETLNRICQTKISKHLPLEIEVSNLNQFILALILLNSAPSPKTVIMLDNMTPSQIKEAVTIRNKAGVAKRSPDGYRGRHILLEASGGIILNNIDKFATTGVDYISIGALTHSPKALDMALRII